MINKLSLHYVKSLALTCRVPTIHCSTTILNVTFIDADFEGHLLYNYLNLNMLRPWALSSDKCFSSEFMLSPLTRIPWLLPKAIAPGSNLIMNTTAVYTLHAFVPIIKTMTLQASRPPLMECQSKPIHLITRLPFKANWSSSGGWEANDPRAISKC